MTKMASDVPSHGLPDLELFRSAISHPERLAVVDVQANLERTYGELVRDVDRLHGKLLATVRKDDLKEERVALLVPNGYAYVVAQWATWAAGGIVVPLLPSHPLPEMQYVVEDSEPVIIVSHDSLEGRAKELGIPYVVVIQNDGSTTEKPPSIAPAEIDLDRGALILYTSGTTGKPKGVVTSHRGLIAQIKSLAEAWRWTPEDRILHFLPLNHVHGIVNALHCPIYVGATVEMMPRFLASTVWERILAPSAPKLTVFTAVPTVYSRMIAQHATLPDPSAASKALKAQFRLMMSGSAPLPSPLKQKWFEVSDGIVLLERMGMSEVGMALSCGMEDRERVDGHVGLPLPGVKARLWSLELDKDVTDEREAAGELQLKGDTVFTQYWRRPEATAKEFTEDGWFKTGDIATRSADNLGGLYRILGRSSQDIIKSGGEKVSALEIEREILSIPGVADVAIVGVDDAEWGQRVSVILVLKEGEDPAKFNLKMLRNVLRKDLAAYKLPTLLRIMDDIPRNQMGKVQKKIVAKVAFGEDAKDVQRL